MGVVCGQNTGHSITFSFSSLVTKLLLRINIVQSHVTSIVIAVVICAMINVTSLVCGIPAILYALKVSIVITIII